MFGIRDEGKSKREINGVKHYIKFRKHYSCDNADKALSTVPRTLNKTTSRLFLKTWLGHQVLCAVLSPKVSATPCPVARGFLSAIGTRLLPQLNERVRSGEERPI